MAKKCKYDVAIITDGNPSIGLAHIRRCSAITSALQSIGLECCFITSDSISATAIKTEGFEAYILNTDYKHLYNQALPIIEILGNQNIRFAFFDSYFASNRLFETVRQWCKVGCFGYGNKYYHGMDIIVPYGISSDPLWYQEQFGNTSVKVLFGSKYIPLSKSFQNAVERDGSPEPKRILLSTGSTDPLNITSILIKAIRAHDITIPIDVVVGPFYNKYLLEVECQGIHNIYYHQGVDDLSRLMSVADVAISAGGITLYELMASSVPIIAYAFVDNQLGNSVLDGIVRWCGDIREKGQISTLVVDRIIRELKEILSNRQARMNLVSKGKSICDGQGALRIAKAIRETICGESEKTEEECRESNICNSN